MPKKPGELKQKVLRRVKKETLAAITKYDLTGQGYNSLHDEVRPWLGVSAKSLQHNTKVLRQVMAKWGRRQIKWGRQEAWKRAGVQVRRPKWLEKVNLTMDSTDLKKEGRRTISKKDDCWSFKENRPGCRYMVVFDLENRVRGLWGGYSPKTYDAHWVLAQKEHFDCKWKGANIVADCHFDLPRDMFENVKIITPVAARAGTTLSEVQQKRNQELRRLRARVESPFGLWKSKWKALSEPWRESDQQQSYLVTLAAGVHNFEL
ncbi:hypothetical protein QOT17_003178 [Balamuthia mandrillaris]